MPVVISTHPKGPFHKPFVYYAIEKCASSWITGICPTLSSNEGMLSVVGGYNIYEDQARILYEKSFGVPNTELSTAQTLHYYYSKLFLKNAFQFTFVRHPLDRFISSWIHGSISPKIGNFTNRFNSTMSTDEMISTFNKFVDSFFGINDVLMGSPHFGKYLSCLPKNIEDLDFIGKLENFNNDMEYVINTVWEQNKKISSRLVKRLIRDADENVKNNVENIHNTKRFRRGIPFEEFYSIESKKIISNYYKKELELFGYE